MVDTRDPSRQPTRSRMRAGKACTRCHEKRIKCDAMQHMPCTRCVRDRHADCVLRETKRGTYTRSALRQKRVRIPLAPGSDVAAPFPTGSSAPNLGSRTIDHAHPQTGFGTSSSQVRSQEGPRASEPAPTHVAAEAPGDGSSYHQISWSAMFDHFLNNRENGQDWIDKCSITYLGESFPLSIVLGGSKGDSRPRLHHLGPPLPTALGNTPFQSQPTNMLSEDLEYLRAKGVFNPPEKAHLNALISIFLDHVYPLYPIVNRQEFIQQYKNEQLSLILTYAISFIAVTFAPESALSLLGFQTRPEARLFFYKKAKALFDMGYETNKITLLQSTFLLSFYGGGPNTYWNFYSWISTAVTIAEGIGIHRSTMAVPNMQPQDKSLMRRLWWALVVRDSICGTLVGRPFRIDLDQADADMLTIEDFAHDAAAPDFLEDPATHRYAQHQIETAKLSQIMREIIISRFYPGRRPVMSDELVERLDRWKADLVPTLTWDAEVPDPSNPFSTALSVQYHHHLILIYLGHRRGEETCRRDEREVDEIIDTAAHHISTVVCMLVTRSAVLSVPHELYHGIFLAQAAFYERMRSSNKLVARLGRSAHNSCQMVLKAISEFWDCGTFIMRLFDNLSSRCLEQQSRTTESGQESRAVGAAEASDVGGTVNAANEAGIFNFNGSLGDDCWQWNPMLESLFDLPPELFLAD
ncbi:hypothetical protein BO82DRAFT_298061 [Aspergillus uvarum CBS 121591]|uniref:Zn(2)-C6 fungal-type domain-containing protein n=1 Tax=Aspergillus uvarum CBS 121591 TaxID=1448315 RepID=A0A319CJU8_9EURO|nr:hypothetical protein BO82DRAFT_298061 [Aspergillus uvarum CBS 121591]PYH75698.1 hypothetical protein BO82DRAFT_298061 [Aspergillus uvarum CBS 121591]